MVYIKNLFLRLRLNVLVVTNLIQHKADVAGLQVFF